MALTDIPFKPGIYSDGTDRDVGKLGYWADCDKVRFFAGMPTKLGGWTRGVADQQFLGVARGGTDWRTSRAEVFLAIGTHLKLYVWSGGTYYDITPLRETTAAGDVTFAASNGSSTITVSDANHGATAGDYVTFSGAVTLGGTITASVLNDDYVVVSVLNPNSYTIDVTVVANGADVGNGGAAVIGEYQISPGAADAIAGLGWGAGVWGDSTWGTPRSVTDFLTQARSWQMEPWGEDLICNPRQGGIYVWDSSAGTSTRAVIISQAPSTSKGILVSPEDRHLIALGAHDGITDDPLLVRWCDQENYTDWTPSLTNTAGNKRLDTGNEILCAAKARGEHLIFTDSALFSMTFVGPPDTFGFRTLGDNGNLVGPLAVHVFEGVPYWMGDRDFFMYDGVTRVLDCTVSAHVFDDFNRVQRSKVYCGVNRDYREVWWLYPSSGSDECDSYVIYNLQDKLWAYGTLARTMLVGDSDVFNYAYGTGADSYLYTHETGTDDFLTAMNAYIESGGIEVDAGGNALVHISKYVPDFKQLTGSVEVTFTGKKYPQATETQVSGPHAITSNTQFANPRMRCRQISVRVESNDLGDDWRMGTLRVDLIPHGGR